MAVAGNRVGRVGLVVLVLVGVLGVGITLYGGDDRLAPPAKDLGGPSSSPQGRMAGGGEEGVPPTAPIMAPPSAGDPGIVDYTFTPGQGGTGVFQPTSPSILPPDVFPGGDEVSASHGVSSPSGARSRCLHGYKCTAHVAIGGACDCDIECDDQNYCNGREKCEDDPDTPYVEDVCVAGVPVNPPGTYGCLEREDMPNGVIPSGRGNYRMCDTAWDCETFSHVNCANPQVCTESRCIVGCDPGLGECSEHCVDNPEYNPGQKFCFDAPGAGGDYNICTYMGHGPEAVCTLGPPGDAFCAGLHGPKSVCLELFIPGPPPEQGLCSCSSDSQCVNGDCNEATGVCRTTGFECFEYVDPPLHPTPGCYEVIGTCCIPEIAPTTPPYCVWHADLTITECNTAGGTWISDRQPAAQNTDETAHGCSTHCPRYSSGVRYRHNANGRPDAYGLDYGFCGISATPCHIDADCPQGDTCVPVIESTDVGPVVMDPCNNQGFLRIGDDYTLAGGSYISLERFGFVGGGDHGNTTVAFEFYDNDTPPKLVTEFVGVVGSGKGYYGWGTRQKPLYRFIPQAIIPPQGWVVIRSGTPEREGVHPGPLHWFSVNSGAVEVGTNNVNLMWVNAGPDVLLGPGHQVLRFELRGVPKANEGFGIPGTPRGTGVPLEACCDDATETCTDELPWECMVCSNNASRYCFVDAHCWSCTGNSSIWCVSDAQCALAGAGTCDQSGECGGGFAYLGQKDECAYNQDGSTVGCEATDDPCNIMGNSWPNAPFYGIFEDPYPTGYCEVVCEEEVTCVAGACCHPDGTCTETAAGECVPPDDWQGYGTTCDPNCCPGGDQGGDFCWDAVPYILDVPDDFVTANVYNIVTTTKHGTWKGVTIADHGPISGQCEYTVCLDPATFTGSGVRCVDDSDCTLPELCVHKPCARQAALGDVLACAAGYCESDGVTQCRDLAGDCPVDDDQCVDYEVCERYDGGDPAKPSMAPDALRWEAFYLPECGYVTVDYCCSDDNPNDPYGIVTPWNRLWPECVNTVPEDPDRKKICEGLRQADLVPGTECTDDNDCAVGTCTGGAPCHDDNDCPLGTCTGGGGDVCRVAGDCPAGETCTNPEPETCAGGQRCEDRRSFLGDNIEQDYPLPNTAQSSYGWWCADGNWANAFELPAGTYWLPIRAQKQCSTNFADCRKDEDCQNEGICQVYHHEYHVHLTVEKCAISACCELDGVCAGTDPNVPENECPGTYFCEDTPAVDCTEDGDFGCTAGTCSVSGGPCHADYVDPVADEVHKDDDCPAGEQCIGYERCMATDCVYYGCSDDPATACTDDDDCTAGTCTGGDPCHNRADCPPGECHDTVTPCYFKEDCPGAFPSCNGASTCTGGATCDPVPCADAPLCTETDRPTCEEQDGWWKEEQGQCQPPGTPPGENVCTDGACCFTDPVEGLVCDDTVYGRLETCMTANQPQFIPGATCAEDPCPVCPFADEDHCQFFDIAAGVMSTCDRYIGRDFMCADDFAALTGGELERVCWWPGFAPPGKERDEPECSDPGLTPAGYWTLRVFEDLGGIPDEGEEMGPAGGQDLAVDISAPTYGRIWQYSAPVGGEGVDPITLVQGECYWLELSGLGESDCVIYWAWSNKGNQYSMQDYNVPDYPNYTPEDANNTDYAFCVDVGMITEGLTEAGCTNVLGACCLCPTEIGVPGACTEETLDDCGLLVDDFGNPGNWSKRRYCNTTPPTDPPPGGDDAVPCEKDTDCTVPGETCQLAVDQCNPNPCAYIPQNDLCVQANPIFHPGGNPANMIETYYDNRCTETESGAPTSCQTPPAGDLAFDLWYRYTVPGCGTVIVDAYRLPIFDSFGALYRIKDLHTMAQPPYSGTFPECCGTDPGLVFDGTEHEYACNDDNWGKGGPFKFEAEVGHDATGDDPVYEELLIRVGGWWDGDPARMAPGRGSSSFTLEFCDDYDHDKYGNCIEHCPDGWTVASPMPAAYPDNRQRNRYLAFDPDPDNAGITVAFKVTMTDITIGSCDDTGDPDVAGWSCRTPNDCRACSTNENPCWTAGLHCEAGETCDLTGADCVNDQAGSIGMSWWVGPAHGTTGVRLLVTQSYREELSAWENPVIVADCEVVPTGVYEVRAVLPGTPPEEESDPLEVKAAPKPDKFWADCVAPLGDHCTGNWRPCTTSTDCGVCYNWLLGPTNPNNGSSLIPCTTDADCNSCSTGGPCMYASDCSPGEICVRSGEWCGVDCILQWPPPDGFISFQDINAAVFTFSGLPTVTPTDVPNIDLHGGTDPNVNPPNYLVNFNDIGLMVQAFAGWPYPYSDPGDCPDVAGW